MRLGYVMAPGAGRADRLLTGLAETALARGLAVRGIVQSNTECGPGAACDMDVRVLPDGPVLRISQSLGPQARGCRLNAGALEEAVGLVQARLEGGADLLVVNKFGKQEAAGQGMRPVIAEALALEIPVIVGLNALNLPAFAAFAEGLADPVAPDPGSLWAWLTGAPVG